jgi:hypothetical protein
MKTLFPAGLKGKELYRYLVANKSDLIREKKSVVKTTDVTFAPCSLLTRPGKIAASKAQGESDDNQMDKEGDVIRVKVVANAANWCDSPLDVLLPDCWKKSIKERKGMIPHLHDHIQQIEAKIGEVDSIYSQDIKLRDLGLDTVGATQCLIFETDVIKSYNEKVFNQYKLKKINQHSIGLRYVGLDLAINDDESEKEMDFWNKYYPQVINKDMVDEYGFFWVVSEIGLLENSCVLFGANELTPTLETEPEQSTSGKSNESAFDVMKAISQTKFVNF